MIHIGETAYQKSNLIINLIDGDLVDNKLEKPKPNLSPFHSKTVVEIFEMFLDDDIINLFVVESNNMHFQ